MNKEVVGRSQDSSPLRKARFGEFEVDFVTGELSREGARSNLPVQPLQILTLLLEHPGELVTRDELQQKLWADTFVDKEHSLNAAVKRLRALIEDEAERPRFIETIPRRGYRFIGKAEVIRQQRAEPVSEPPVVAAEPLESLSRPSSRRWLLWLLAGVVVLVALLGVARHPAARWWNNRGAGLQQRGDLAGAIRSYERSLAIDASYPEARYNLAAAYEELSRYDDAMKQYERAVELDDKFYEAYNNLAHLYLLRKNDPAAALVLLDRALNSHPAEPVVQYSLYKNRGWANLQLRYPLQAERDLKQAISLEAKRAAAHCLLAQTFEARQDAKAAVTEWEACVAYSPGEKDVEAGWIHLAQERLQESDSRIKP